MSIPYNENVAELSKFPVGIETADDPVWVTYEQFVTSLVKERGAVSANLEHMVIGICGEAGEIADGIKKNSIYGKPLDRINIVEELGDIEFYLAGLRQMLGISRYETLAANVMKLGTRYKNGYSDAAAIERADKVEPQLQIIDMSKNPAAAAAALAPPPSPVEVAGADSMFGNLAETATEEAPPEIRDWVLPLIDAYHAGKTVQAISYSSSGAVATVLFVGELTAVKLYRPAGEV